MYGHRIHQLDCLAKSAWIGSNWLSSLAIAGALEHMGTWGRIPTIFWNKVLRMSYFLNIVPTKFKTELFLSPVSTNTFRRYCSGFHGHTSKILNEIYSEPLRHALPPCEDPFKTIFNFI